MVYRMPPGPRATSFTCAVRKEGGPAWIPAQIRVVAIPMAATMTTPTIRPGRPLPDGMTGTPKVKGVPHLAPAPRAADTGSLKGPEGTDSLPTRHPPVVLSSVCHDCMDRTGHDRDVDLPLRPDATAFLKCLLETQSWGVSGSTLEVVSPVGEGVPPGLPR